MEKIKDENTFFKFLKAANRDDMNKIADFLALTKFNLLNNIPIIRDETEVKWQQGKIQAVDYLLKIFRDNTK